MSKVDGVSRYESIPPLENNFPIKIQKYVTANDTVPHWHEHIELVSVIDGDCSFTVNGKSFSCHPGDIAVVNSTEIHSISIKSNKAEYLCIIIYPEFFSDVSFSGVLLDNIIIKDERLTELVAEMYRESKERSIGSDMMQKSIAYSIMTCLAREHLAERITEKYREQHIARLGRLSAVFDYVSQNYTSRISTLDLSAICYLSEAHFCRFFKSSTGRTPLEYVNEYRIERAALLLENTDIPLSEISGSVGIEDANYFSRMFKKIKKISPNKYRAQHRTHGA